MKCGREYQQMNINILKNLRSKVIYRIDVNFNIPMKSLDALIGRAAHMMFIEQQTVMRMIIYRYGHFFTPFNDGKGYEEVRESESVGVSVQNQGAGS